MVIFTTAGAPARVVIVIIAASNHLTLAGLCEYERDLITHCNKLSDRIHLLNNQILLHFRGLFKYQDFDITAPSNESFLYIVQNQNKIPATQGSGFQKFIITLAIRLSLAKSHPLLPNFLILDEGFGCMDSDHLTSAIDFLHQLSATQLDWLLFVSHIPEMRCISSTAIVVANTLGVSTVFQ